MTKKAFKIEGDFQMGRVRQHFDVAMVGTDEDAAREALYTDIGSRHGVKRRDITITSIRPATEEELDPITAHRIKE